MRDIQNATNMWSFEFSERPLISDTHCSLHLFQEKRNHSLPYQMIISTHKPAVKAGGRWSIALTISRVFQKQTT